MHLPGIFSGQNLSIHCLPIATRRLQVARHCPSNLSQSLSHTDMQTHRSQQICPSSAHRWAPKLMQLMPKLYRDRIYPGWSSSARRYAATASSLRFPLARVAPSLFHRRWSWKRGQRQKIKRNWLFLSSKPSLPNQCVCLTPPLQKMYLSYTQHLHP